MKKIIIAVSTILFLLSFSSINNFAQKTYNEIMYPVPECSDESVTSAIDTLYREMRQSTINGAYFNDSDRVAQSLPLSIKRLNMTHSTGYDEATRRMYCEAEAVFDVVIRDGFSPTHEEITAPITYVVQSDEKDIQQYSVTLLPDFLNNTNLQQRVMGMQGTF